MHEFKPKAWMTCPLCRKQSPMPDPDHREWVGLTDMERQTVINKHEGVAWETAIAIEAKLKEKNA